MAQIDFDKNVISMENFAKYGSQLYKEYTHYSGVPKIVTWIILNLWLGFFLLNTQHSEYKHQVFL